GMNRDPDLIIPDFSRMRLEGVRRRSKPEPIECITLSDTEESSGKEVRAVSLAVSDPASRAQSEDSRSSHDSLPVLRTRKKQPTPVLPKQEERKWKTAAEIAAESLDTKQRKWQIAKQEAEKKDPEDEDIDNFIRENQDKPNSYWDTLTAKMEKMKKGFEIDYLITTESHPKPLAGKHEVWVLTKWSNYAVPTWNLNTDVNTDVKKNADQLVMMEGKLEMEKRLASTLTTTLGGQAAFDYAFPNRWTEAYGELGKYVEDERCLYLNKTRAWEWRMNFEYQAMNKALKNDGQVPPIYVINWVDEGVVPGMDNDFKFITKLKHTQLVANILANTDEMGWVKCCQEEDQFRCKTSCSMPKEHYSAMSDCCGAKYGAVIHYDKRRMHARMVDPTYVETAPEVGEATKTQRKKKKTKEKKKREDEEEANKVIVPAQLTSHEVENGIILECTKECGCVHDQCRQQLVQRGRQIPLIVFREDAVKGWGLRAGADIKLGEFVTEYVGEVLTAAEQAEHHFGSHYMFTMRFGWAENMLRTDRVRNVPAGEKNIIRRHKPFSVDATNMGNESRFINHSCEPNLVAMAVFVERHGEFYHRIALFARKNIAFGEELTFDYFPSDKDIGAWRSMFDKCRCGTESCKLKERESEDSSDDETASVVSSVDSFLSDDEEYQRVKEVKEKKKCGKKGKKNKK
ncbi:hypothetical protein PMAYCL1PPCAC_03819, partial [Pristionchus mayeri]